MIGYVLVGTNDAARATAFYDGLMEQLGAKRVNANDRVTLWTTGQGTPMMGISVPFDGEPSTAGNGVMIAIQAGSKEGVNQMHAKAMELGATDEGAPGPRGEGNFYGGYFRDLDGNKLVAFCMG